MKKTVDKLHFLIKINITSILNDWNFFTSIDIVAFFWWNKDPYMILIYYFP